jgi:hypothetical protein
MDIDEDKILKIWSRIVKLETDRYIVDLYEPSYHILSFGGGRQTVALLLKMRKLFSNNPNSYVVFADTGGEHQETYDYMDDYIVPFCKANNIKFVRVHNKYGKTLYDYCWDKKIVPSIKFRDCTSKFKIAPIRKFLRQELKIDRKHPCNMYIGISYDEADRMNPSNVKYAKSVYPFVDGYRNYCESGLTLDDCVNIVISEGFPPVPKSGCYFCPFAKTMDLLDPRYNAKTIALEENNSRFPEIKLRGMGKNVKTVKELSKDDVGRDGCKSGYCMV